MESRSPIPSATELDSQGSHDSFVWDDDSQLYFHAGSGFYHDPTAGWYYSTRDGLYYKFEDGNYVLLHQAGNLETYDTQVTVFENPIQEDPSAHQNEGIETVPQEPNAVSGSTECSSSGAPGIPPPPSEWLEDTLIELYLSGYSNLEVNVADDMAVIPGTDVELGADGNNGSHVLDEGELRTDDHHAESKSNENVSDEGFSWEEENWRAQYGQVIRSAELPVAESSITSLWDWEMIRKPRKDGKGEVARLSGRLVKLSAKLHPSMPSGGGLLKTAAICEAHLDLVRVMTGQVYKLRSPNTRYLASLSTYDASNPTKDWGFPELSDNRQILPLSKSSVDNIKSKSGDPLAVSKHSSLLPCPAYEKVEGYAYRDRAADRRSLHGGFGVGPGQKSLLDSDSDLPGSTEEAAAEALDMSFGAGSYARTILENMGWKEGEALGKTTKGLTEPIQAHGNVGNAGLGWPHGRLKHC